jgi:hypothetical protein
MLKAGIEVQKPVKKAAKKTEAVKKTTKKS